jgi:pimeloyl-ACP methyl ester carboxylesterase
MERHSSLARFGLVLAASGLLLACATTGNSARSLGEANPRPAPPAGLVDTAVPILRTASGVEFVRTPEERFKNLKDFPYEAHYLEVDGLRLAYEDEGPADAPVVLMLHVQPDWSYLYRKMIPPITAAGYRCIALDLMGFGRSDKPVDGSIHIYEQQVAWVKEFIHVLGLHDITLFCQDWGGLIGLRIVGDEPELFARVIAANTYLPLFDKGTNPYRLPANLAVDPRATSLAAALVPAMVMGQVVDPRATSLATTLGPAMVMGRVTMFNAWIQFCLTSPTFMPSEVMRQSVKGLTDAEAAAYDAPFPSYVYKAAPRTFPSMLVAIDDNNAAAWASLGRFAKPFLALTGERDYLLGKRDIQDRLIAQVPGAKGQKHARFDAGHFIQDDLGPEMAAIVIKFIADNTVPQGSNQ